MPTLEIYNELKAFMVSLSSIPLGGSLFFLAADISKNKECRGRGILFCEFLQSFPYEVRLGICYLFGAVVFYFGITLMISVFHQHSILRLDNQGIAFKSGAEVLVPWSQVTSFDVNYRFFTFYTIEPVRARNVFGWNSMRNKIVVPINIGVVHLDGEKMSGKAAENIANWLRNMTSTPQNQQA
jgi:hypothetical protein